MQITCTVFPYSQESRMISESTNTSSSGCSVNNIMWPSKFGRLPVDRHYLFQMLSKKILPSGKAQYFIICGKLRVNKSDQNGFLSTFSIVYDNNWKRPASTLHLKDWSFQYLKGGYFLGTVCNNYINI